MSHFSVVVCTDDPSSLDKIMAPWDEGREVEPYRRYEDGGPEDYWLYCFLKRTADNYADGTGIKPYKPDEIGWSSASSKKTPEQQREEQRQDAEVFASLPSPITWADIAKLHNERYGDDDSSPLLVSEDGLRGYTMSTYNPDSKWDYWRIGGRWGGYFTYRAECAAQVIKPERGWDSPQTIMPLHCDGGPKSALDLAAMREEKAAEARKRYAEYQATVAGTPDALPWSVFAENVSEGSGYTWDQAREEYHSQPRVQALKGTDFQWEDDVIATYGKPGALYAEQARAQAVPGFATVTLDGRWMAPGHMGCFAATDATEASRIGYWEAANAYIEALPESTFLVALDCHI